MTLITLQYFVFLNILILLNVDANKLKGNFANISDIGEGLAEMFTVK